MSLVSFKFVVFFIILLLVYYKVPSFRQWPVILAGSMLFYAFASPVGLLILCTSIVSTWFLMRNPVKSHFILTLIINLGLLVIFRYSVYFGIHGMILPLGISFYTFMTLGYAHDCYEQKIPPCDNLFHYALFVSYFPQITQGPIGTYQIMMGQLLAPHSFDLHNIKEGGYRIIKGLFKKFVIAGRLTYYVDTVFSSVDDYGGLTLITAVFFYMIELYADFSGYMDIACGISDMLGIKLAENFMRPYFSTNIQEFWRRWHISLNEWFKVHLMIPASSSEWNKKVARFLGKVFPKAKKGTLRTICPLIIVWVTTGIWHGPESVYIGWGIYFAIIMLLSVCTASFSKKLGMRLHLDNSSVPVTVFRTVRTFLIVMIGEAIFRAHSLGDALTIYKTVLTDTHINRGSIASALAPFGNGNQAVASAMILFVLIVGFFAVELIKEIKPAAFTGHKYINAGALIVITILFGVIGQSNFLYQAF